MALHDPIADLLTRIRNAARAQLRFLDIPHSIMKEAIVKIMKENGFIAQYLVKEEDKKKTLRVFLKFTPERGSIIHQLKRVSKPSLRKYVTHFEIPRVLGGMGISILSTSKGVMDGKTARKMNIGGELLCQVW
ncbi:MAG: 30S ribosomal protein S8 [Chlamydiae bacterium]|nr:30S ribosomal protein S8 [Chlamydiota bacterium]